LLPYALKQKRTAKIWRSYFSQSSKFRSVVWRERVGMAFPHLFMCGNAFLHVPKSHLRLNDLERSRNFPVIYEFATSNFRKKFWKVHCITTFPTHKACWAYAVTNVTSSYEPSRSTAIGRTRSRGRCWAASQLSHRPVARFQY